MLQMQNKPTGKSFLFDTKNYRFLFLAIAIISLGYILMSGGGSDDPLVFSPEIFNFQRIRLAPSLVLAGFGVAIYAILADSKSDK